MLEVDFCLIVGAWSMAVTLWQQFEYYYLFRYFHLFSLYSLAHSFCSLILFLYFHFSFFSLLTHLLTHSFSFYLPPFLSSLPPSLSPLTSGR